MKPEAIQALESNEKPPLRKLFEAVTTRVKIISEKTQNLSKHLLSATEKLSNPAKREALKNKTHDLLERAGSRMALLRNGTLLALAINAAPAFAEDSQVRSVDKEVATAEQMLEVNGTLDAAYGLANMLAEKKINLVKDNLTRLTSSDEIGVQERTDAALNLATGTPLLGKVLKKNIPGLGIVDGVNKLQKSAREGDSDDTIEATLNLAKNVPKIAGRFGPLLSILSHLNDLRMSSKGGKLTPGEVVSSFGKIILDAHTLGVGSILIDLIKGRVALATEVASEDHSNDSTFSLSSTETTSSGG